ncbi:MAG: CHAD domain-containing protein [Bacteroidales bacterium]|nr:CHAD domain-containing protein [Bacteroidales bacterium]
MKNRIEKYFIKQLTAFEKNFKKSKKEFDIEAIHEMRLSIKRTKALFLFFEYIDPDNFNARNEFKSIKHLFKMAGNIRDIQVQIRLVKNIRKGGKNKYKPYIKHLRAKETEAIVIFNKEVKESLHQEVITNQDKILNVLREVTNEERIREKTITLLNDKISHIDKLRKDLGKEENIHEIRTTIKQIQYLFAFTKKYVSKKLFLQLSKKKLKKIENIFGDWHDRVNGLNLLTNYLESNQETDPGEYEFLKNKLELGKKMLFMQIKHILNKKLLFFFVLEL